MFHPIEMTTQPVEGSATQTDGMRLRLPWQVAFIILAGIWGCSFFFIKVGLEGLDPIQVAF
jgi:hypothetical protein